MKKRTPVALFFVISLSGCAIQQTVKPVERFAEREVCIIESPAVKAGFLEAYKRMLVSKGYLVKQLPPSSTLMECKVVSTYTANWRWDLATYMAYAEIKVYSAGNLIGEAKYDSLRGGANMGKFIDADKKIEELVDQLFPGDAGH